MSYGSPTGNQGYPDPTNYDDDSSAPGNSSNSTKYDFVCVLKIIIMVLGVCMMIFGIISPGFLPIDNLFVEHSADIFILGLLSLIAGFTYKILWGGL